MPSAPTAALERRHRSIRDDLAAHGLDALVVTSLPNILYLTGFTGSSAIAVVTAERVYFLTDFRYVTTITATRGTPGECPSLELVTVDGSYDATLARLLGGNGWTRIGVEAAHLTLARHQWLTSSLASEASTAALVPTERIVERARMRKDEHEEGREVCALRALAWSLRDKPAEEWPGALLHLGDNLTAKEVFDLAAAGDERAKRIFEIMGEMLGIALAMLANIFNYPLYLLSGGILPA